MTLGVIAGREFVERMRSRWFIVSTAFLPLLMLLGVLVPVFLGTDDAELARPARGLVAIGALPGDALPQPGNDDGAIRIVAVPGPVSTAAAREMIERGAYDVVLGRDEGGMVLVYASGLAGGGLGEMRRLADRLNLMLGGEADGVDGRALDSVVQGRRPVEVRLEGRGGAASSQMLMAYTIWILLYFAITVYGVRVMGAVVAEKSTRIVDLLVTAARPFDLLAGKILGVGSVGLLQMGIWLLSAAIAAEVGGAALGSYLGHFDAALIGIVLVYFILGYFLYAALFASIAAIASNETEARQAQLPIILLLIVPSWLIIATIDNPDGWLSALLSYVPFWSPMGMPVRWMVGGVSDWAIAVSLIVLAFSVLVASWMAGRIYRVGMLVRGSRPRISEVLRWLGSG